MLLCMHQICKLKHAPGQEQNPPSVFNLMVTTVCIDELHCAFTLQFLYSHILHHFTAYGATQLE